MTKSSKYAAAHSHILCNSLSIKCSDPAQAKKLYSKLVQPKGLMKAVWACDSLATGTCKYPQARSKDKKYHALPN